AGVLRGAEISQATVMPSLRLVDDWSFSVSIDGTDHDVAGIDGSTAATLADVVSQIQAEITPAVAVVSFDGTRIVFASPTTGAASIVGFPEPAPTGTFIGDILAIAAGSGAAKIDGKASTPVAPESQLEALSAIKSQVNVKGAGFIDKILDAQVPLIASWATANSVIVYET
ncbi:DUF3383 family protein, partial [Yersinia enterocolitica]